MSIKYESWFSTILGLSLNSTDTVITLAVAPTVTNGRIYIFDWTQKEWVDFTGVSGVTITWCTRNVSSTADPMTGGTGYNFNAGTPVVLVAMHDQLPDKTTANTWVGDQTITGNASISGLLSFTGTDTAWLKIKSLTTTQRDALTPANGMKIYNSTTGTEQTYYGGTWNDAGTNTTPNATTTVAGKVELPTDAQNTAGTDIGETGASLTPTPWQVAKAIQSGSYLYAGASATGNDTYVVSMTPDLTAYTTGMRISFKADVANTGACSINIDALGAKAIKTNAGADPSNGAIAVNQFVLLMYDGTNFVLQNTLMATDVEASLGADTSKTINSLQLRNFYWPEPSAWTTYTLASLATNFNTTSSTYVIARTVAPIVRAGTYTFASTIESFSGDTGTGIIYKNGVSTGITATRAGTGTTALGGDIAVAVGDVITFLLKLNAGSSINLKDVTVKYNLVDWKTGLTIT